MGIYIFSCDALAREVSQDAKRNTAHDFGKNIIPAMLDRYKVFAYPFEDENRKTTSYWRDIGTLDSYYEANMDLVNVDPEFNLYDAEWPIRTHVEPLPPAKTVWRNEERQGRIMESMVCNGSIISGGTVVRSIIGPNVRVNSFAYAEECIIFSDVSIGRKVRLRRVIMDKDVIIPEGTEIGYNLEEDRKRFLVTEKGVVVVPKGYVF